MKKAWKLFPELAARTKEEAEAHAQQNGAHDYVHDVTVAQYCLIIAPDREIGRMAAAAALCHSTDRRFPDENEDRLSWRIFCQLNQTDLSQGEKSHVVHAVLCHHKPNKSEDGIVLVVLKDADRLANLGLPAVVRCGQRYHSLQTLNPRYVASPDPEATYKDPRTVLHDVRSALEWDPREDKPQFCLRLPKAIELGTPYFDWLKLGLQLAERQLVETEVRELLS